MEPKSMRGLPLAAMLVAAAMPVGLPYGQNVFEIDLRRQRFRDPLGPPPDDLDRQMAEAGTDLRDILAVLRNAPIYTPKPKQRKKFRHNRRG